MSQLCGIGQRCINMNGLESRVTSENLVAAGSFGQTVKNSRDKNPRPFHTQLPMAELGVVDQILTPLSHRDVLAFLVLDGERTAVLFK